MRSSSKRGGARPKLAAVLSIATALTIVAGWMAPAAHAAGGDLVPQAPAAPTRISAVAGDHSAVVYWDPPSDDGGVAISEYEVRAEPSGTTLTFDGTTTTGEFDSLENGVATRFVVTASNAMGRSAPSDASAAVTPRGVARFVIRHQPDHRIVYGTSSLVKADLITKGGLGVPNQRVELLARLRPSTKWRTVKAGFTNDRGRVALKTTLPGSAALRLHHPASIVAAPDADVRNVVVAKRIRVRAGNTRTRLGMPVIVRGRVAPDQTVGSGVRLQQKVDGTWRQVASGNMVTRERFRIRWDPRHVQRYKLRVVKGSDSRRAAGISSTWRHRVDPETAADIAKDILRNKRIDLERVHLSGGGYLASPHDNIVDVSQGRRARHSCHGGAPCGSTRIDLRVLHAIRDLGTRADVTISEIAGGVHSSGSDHYSGRAIDITWVNGRHVGAGASYDMVVNRCRAYGAKVIFTPGYDPYGGHQNHVHCAWK